MINVQKVYGIINYGFKINKFGSLCKLKHLVVPLFIATNKCSGLIEKL